MQDVAKCQRFLNLCCRQDLRVRSLEEPTVSLNQKETPTHEPLKE